MNINYRLKLSKTPPLYYNFFRKIAHNYNFIQNHCNDLNNRFQFSCRRWYKYNNPGYKCEH